MSQIDFWVIELSFLAKIFSAKKDHQFFPPTQKSKQILQLISTKVLVINKFMIKKRFKPIST
jgi:hypothetical protein